MNFAFLHLSRRHMHLHLGHCRAFGLIAVTAVALLFGSPAFAQDDDPCLQELAGDQAALQRYDAIVGDYLESRDGGDTQRQIELLDQLEAVCNANLRIRVFRGEAFLANGSCEQAVNEYLGVVDAAEGWPYRANAEDARDRASSGLAAVRETCIASVQVNCQNEGAQVVIGDRAPQACPAVVDVAAGTYPVVVSASGHTPLTREYTFRLGNNFVEVEALQPLQRAGEVEFVCNEPGSEVVIGPERFGCPAVRTFEAGEMRFTVLRPRSEPFESTVTVVEGARTTVYAPEAGGAAGTLLGECTPAGARVFVSGPDFPSAVEQTCPFSIPVSPGRYTLQITATNHADAERVVDVGNGETVRLNVALEATAPERGYAFEARILGGIGTPFGADTVENDEIVGAGKAAFNVSFKQQATAFEFGGYVRMGFADELGILGGVSLGYVIPFDPLSIALGASLGYGTNGYAAPEGEDVAAFTYSAYLSLVYNFGMLQLVIQPELYIGADQLVFDGVAGIGVVF